MWHFGQIRNYSCDAWYQVNWQWSSWLHFMLCFFFFLSVLKPTSHKCRGSKKYVVSDQVTLSSLVTDETGCGSLETPWVISVSTGQRISLSMTDFNTAQSSNGNCIAHGYIIERDFQVNQTICGSGDRDGPLYESRGSTLELQILPAADRNMKGNFLINYKGMVSR